ncbi:MAG: septum formation initiator family protein [Fidelibacterota bacterium]
MNRRTRIRRKTGRRFRRLRLSRAAPRRGNIVPKLFLLAGLILVIIFFFGDHGIYRLYEMRREKEHLLKEIDRLRGEQQTLLGEKERLENDLEYIERLARERHRMAKPREKVFKVVERPGD